MTLSPEGLEVESSPFFPSARSETASATATEPAPAQAARHDAADKNLYLLGRPTLKHYLRYVRSHAVSPPSEKELTDEWCTAGKRVRNLEREEPGLADDPPIGKLGPEYDPLLIEFLKDPLVRNGYNTVPSEVGLVELDRLVVYQKHIDLTFVRQLEDMLGPAPGKERIFRTCLLHDHPQPPARWSRVHNDKFVFMSPSNDLRFLGPLPIQAGHIKDYPAPGRLVGVVGIAVGFGSNLLNAICVERRLILNNGSHRAYALRKSGCTHVPCLIQHVSTRDELELVGSTEVRRDPDLYLKHPRPSMLKDYFDPRLHKVMAVNRRLRQVTVSFEVDENSVPAL